MDTFTYINAKCINNDFTLVVDEQLNHPNVFLRKSYLNSKSYEQIKVSEWYNCYSYQESTYPNGFGIKHEMVKGDIIYTILDPTSNSRKLLTIYEKDFHKHFIDIQEIRDNKIDFILNENI